MKRLLSSDNSILGVSYGIIFLINSNGDKLFEVNLSNRFHKNSLYCLYKKIVQNCFSLQNQIFLIPEVVKSLFYKPRIDTSF